jgi:Ca2+:H+ antiporter
VSAVAIPPLAATFTYATNEVRLRLGEWLGAVLSFTFSNLALMFLGSFAMFKGQVDIVKELVCGGILTNILLVQGVGSCAPISLTMLS